MNEDVAKILPGAAQKVGKGNATGMNKGPVGKPLPMPAGPNKGPVGKPIDPGVAANVGWNPASPTGQWPKKTKAPAKSWAKKPAVKPKAKAPADPADSQVNYQEYTSPGVTELPTVNDPDVYPPSGQSKHAYRVQWR